MRNSLTPYFLSLAGRKLVLRLVLISCLFAFVVYLILGIQDIVHHESIFRGCLHLGLIINPILVSIHHIVRLWPSKKWLVRSDLIYSAVEFVIVTGCPIAEYFLLRALGVITIGIVAGAILGISVGISFFLAIWRLHASQYRTFGSIYDFVDDDGHTSVARQRGLKGGQWSLVFGVNMFRRRFGTDQVFVRGLRAVVSILCLLGMIALGYLVLILQPIQQHGYFRSTQVSSRDLGYTDGKVRLGVDPFTSTLNNPSLPPIYAFDFDVTWRPEPDVPCKRGVGSANNLACDVWSPFSPSAPDNLIIKINFTRALPKYPTTDLRTGVYLYFYTDPHDVRDFAPIPIQLYPGFHLFGTTFYSFRDRYANSRHLAFGIPQYNRHLLMNVQALVPDPEFANSDPDNTTATLRLTYQGNLESVQGSYDVQKEQSSDSVVNGFALVGGAWTFINGVFATVFGCRLLLVLFGIKPLSIYGLVHIFQRRRSLVDSGYALSAEEQNRVIAVFREHLLDNDDESGGPRTRAANQERGPDETREDGGEEQRLDYDISRKHLLADVNRDLEAGDASEESKRGIELRNLHNIV